MPVFTTLRRVHAGAVGEHQRVADVFDLLDAAAEHREARLVVHRPVPRLGDELRVALVAAERVDPQPLARGEPTSITDARGTSFSRVLRCRRRRIRGRSSDARTSSIVGRPAGEPKATSTAAPAAIPSEQPAEHVGRESGAEVHRRDAPRAG